MAGFLAQILNGLQYGLLLFLISSGLTLIFGVMRVINLAHGSLFMIGAYLAYVVVAATGEFWFAPVYRHRRRNSRSVRCWNAVCSADLSARTSRSGVADLRTDPAARGSPRRVDRQPVSTPCRCLRRWTSPSPSWAASLLFCLPVGGAGDLSDRRGLHGRVRGTDPRWRLHPRRRREPERSTFWVSTHGGSTQSFSRRERRWR